METDVGTDGRTDGRTKSGKPDEGRPLLGPAKILLNLIKVDKGEGEEGRRKWIKNIVNIIHINFAIVDKGLGGGG